MRGTMRELPLPKDRGEPRLLEDEEAGYFVADERF
jgi:hypothetical protein